MQTREWLTQINHHTQHRRIASFLNPHRGMKSSNSLVSPSRRLLPIRNPLCWPPGGCWNPVAALRPASAGPSKDRGLRNTSEYVVRPPAGHKQAIPAETLKRSTLPLAIRAGLNNTTHQQRQTKMVQKPMGFCPQPQNQRQIFVRRIQ